MLWDLTEKELKNTLRDKKIIITSVLMPLIIFGVMGAIYGFAFGRAGKAVKESVSRIRREGTILICSGDRGLFTDLLAKFSHGFAHNVTVVYGCGLNDVLSLLSKGNPALAVYVPEGASANLSNLKPIQVYVYARTNKASFTSSLTINSLMSSYVSSLTSSIRTQILISKGLPPSAIISPVRADERVVFRGTVTKPGMLSELSGSLIMFAFAPLIVVSMALGQAASSMAVENEEKTLEVLLSLPISRFKLVLSKLMGSVVIVFLSTLSFAAGLGIYGYSIYYATASFSSEGVGSPGSQGVLNGSLISNLVSPWFAATLIAGTFLSLLGVASLGILLGSLAPDVRTSSTLVGQLSLLVIIPGFILVFLDFSSLGLVGQLVMLAFSPFVAPILILKGFLENLPWVTPAALAWSLAFAGFLIYLSSKLLDSERLLTLQHKLLRRRLRGWGMLGRRRHEGMP